MHEPKCRTGFFFWKEHNCLCLFLLFFFFWFLLSKHNIKWNETTLTYQYRVSDKEVRRAIHVEIEWRNANDDRHSCATFTNVVAAFEFVVELSMSGNKTRISTGSYLNHTGFLWMWFGSLFHSFPCCCCSLSTECSYFCF